MTDLCSPESVSLEVDDLASAFAGAAVFRIKCSSMRRASRLNHIID